MDENHDGIETVELEGYTVVRKEMEGYSCMGVRVEHGESPSRTV